MNKGEKSEEKTRVRLRWDPENPRVQQLFDPDHLAWLNSLSDEEFLCLSAGEIIGHENLQKRHERIEREEETRVRNIRFRELKEDPCAPKTLLRSLLKMDDYDYLLSLSEIARTYVEGRISCLPRVLRDFVLTMNPKLESMKCLRETKFYKKIYSEVYSHLRSSSNVHWPLIIFQFHDLNTLQNIVLDNMLFQVTEKASKNIKMMTMRSGCLGLEMGKSDEDLTRTEYLTVLSCLKDIKETSLVNEKYMIGDLFSRKEEIGNALLFKINLPSIRSDFPYLYYKLHSQDHVEDYKNVSRQDRRMRDDKDAKLNQIPRGAVPQVFDSNKVLESFDRLTLTTEMEFLRMAQREGEWIRHLLHDRLLLILAQVLTQELKEAPHIDKKIHDSIPSLAGTEYARLSPDLVFNDSRVIADISFTSSPSESANSKHQKYDPVANLLSTEESKWKVLSFAFSSVDGLPDIFEMELKNLEAVQRVKREVFDLFQKIERVRGRDFLVPVNLREGYFEFKFESTSPVILHSVDLFRTYNEYLMNSNEVNISLKIHNIHIIWPSLQSLEEDIIHRKIMGGKNAATFILIDLISFWSLFDLEVLPKCFRSLNPLDVRSYLLDLLMLSVHFRVKGNLIKSQEIFAELKRLDSASSSHLAFQYTWPLEHEEKEKKTFRELVEIKYQSNSRVLRESDFRIFSFPKPAKAYCPVSSSYTNDYRILANSVPLLSSLVKKADTDPSFLFIDASMEREDLIRARIRSLMSEDEESRISLKKYMAAKTARDREKRKNLKTVVISEQSSPEIWSSLPLGPEKKRFEAMYLASIESKKSESEIKSILGQAIFEKIQRKKSDGPLSISSSEDMKYVEEAFIFLRQELSGWTDPEIPMRTDIDSRIESFYTQKLRRYCSKNYSLWLSSAGNIAREIALNCFRHRPRGNKKERKMILSLTQDRRNFVLIYPGARLRDHGNTIWAMVIPVEPSHSKVNRSFEWTSYSEHHLNLMISIERTMFAMFCHLTEVEQDSIAVDSLMAAMTMATLSLSKNVAETLKAIRNVLAKEYDVDKEAVRDTVSKFPDRLSSPLSVWFLQKLLSKKSFSNFRYDEDELDEENPSFKNLKFYSWISNRLISQETFSLEMYLFFVCEKEVGVDQYHGLDSALYKLNSEGKTSRVSLFKDFGFPGKSFFGHHDSNRMNPEPGAFSNVYTLTAISNMKSSLSLNPAAIFSKFRRDFLKQPASSLASFKTGVREVEVSSDPHAYEISVAQYEIWKKKALQQRERKRIEAQKQSDQQRQDPRISMLNKVKAEIALSETPEEKKEDVAALFGQFYTEEQLKNQNLMPRLQQLSQNMVDEDNEIDWDVIQELIESGKRGIEINKGKVSNSAPVSRYYLKGRGKLPSRPAFRNFTAKRCKVIDWVYEYLKSKGLELQSNMKPEEVLTSEIFYRVFFREHKLCEKELSDFVFFLKQQVGVREISIAQVRMMLMNRFCEALSRSICSFVPCDYSDSGATKDINYSMNIRSAHKSLRTERKFQRSAEINIKSGDKKSWCTNFPTFSVALLVGIMTESEEVFKIMADQSHCLSNRRYSHEYETLKKKLKVASNKDQKVIEENKHLFNERELDTLKAGGKLDVYDLFVESYGSFPQGFMQMGSSLFHSCSVLLCERYLENLTLEYPTSRVEQISMLTSDDSLRTRVVSSTVSGFVENMMNLARRFDSVTDECTNMKDSLPKTVVSSVFSELNQRVMFASSISSTPFKNIMQSQQPLNSSSLKECASEAVSRAQSCLYEGSSIMTSSVVLQLILDDLRKNLNFRMESLGNLTDKGSFPVNMTIESILFSVESVQKRNLLDKVSNLYDNRVIQLFEDLQAEGIIKARDVGSILKRKVAKTQPDSYPDLDLTSFDDLSISELCSSLDLLLEAYYFRLSDLNDSSIEDGSSFGRIATSSLSMLKKSRKLRKLGISRKSVNAKIQSSPLYFLEETVADSMTSLEKRYLNPKSGSGDLTSPVSNFLRITLNRHMSFTMDGEEMVFAENLPVLLDREINNITIKNVLDFSSDLRIMNSSTPLIQRVEIPDFKSFREIKPRYSYSPVSVRTHNLFTTLSSYGFFRRWVRETMTDSDKLSLQRLSHVFQFPHSPEEVRLSLRSEKMSEEESSLRYSNYLKEIFGLITRSKKNTINMLCKGGSTANIFHTLSSYLPKNLYSRFSLDAKDMIIRNPREIDEIIQGLVSFAAKTSKNHLEFRQYLAQIKTATIDGFQVEPYVMSTQQKERGMKESLFHRVFFGLERASDDPSVQVFTNYLKSGAISSLVTMMSEKFISTTVVSKKISEVVLGSDDQSQGLFRIVTSNLTPDDEDALLLLVRAHLDKFKNFPCLPQVNSKKYFFVSQMGRVTRRDPSSPGAEEISIVFQDRDLSEEGYSDDLIRAEQLIFLRSAESFAVYRDATNMYFTKSNQTSKELKVLFKFKMSMPSFYTSHDLKGLSWEYAFLDFSQQLKYCILNDKIADKDPGINIGYAPPSSTCERLYKDGENAMDGKCFSEDSKERLKDALEEMKASEKKLVVSSSEQKARNPFLMSKKMVQKKTGLDASRGMKSLRLTAEERSAVRSAMLEDASESGRLVNKQDLESMREALSLVKDSGAKDSDPEFKDFLEDEQGQIRYEAESQPVTDPLHKYKVTPNKLMDLLPEAENPEAPSENPEFKSKLPNLKSEQIRKRQNRKFHGGFMKILCNAFFGMNSFPSDRHSLISAYFTACLYAMLLTDIQKTTSSKTEKKEIIRKKLFFLWSAVELTYFTELEELVEGRSIDERIIRKAAEFFDLQPIEFAVEEFSLIHDNNDSQETNDAWD